MEPRSGDWSAESGYHAGLALAENPLVTAIFAANDQMAVGVLRALHEAGRSVPTDISVVGFDDGPEAAYLIPPLTTVCQDFDATGRAAITTLTAAILGEPHHRRSVIDLDLIVRASSAPPPVRNACAAI